MFKIESDEIGATVSVKEEILDSSQFERNGLIELETEEIEPMTLTKAQYELKLCNSIIFGSIMFWVIWS